MTFKLALPALFALSGLAAAAPALAQPSALSQQQLTDHLATIGFSDIRFDEVDDGRYEFEVRDADGRRIDIELWPDATIHSLDVDDDRRASTVNLATLLPASLQQAIADLGIVDLMEFDTNSRHYEIEGYDAQGRKIEIDIPL